MVDESSLPYYLSKAGGGESLDSYFSLEYLHYMKWKHIYK